MFKRIFIILIFSFFFFNSANATKWEIFYAIKNNVKVNSAPFIDRGNTITYLKPWYIVSEIENSRPGWKKIKLTDGKIWYVKLNNLALNSANPYKINWNMWKLNKNSKIYYLSNYNRAIWNLKKCDLVAIEHVNLVDWSWVRVKVVSWEKTWLFWYVNKNDLNFFYLDDYKSKEQKFIDQENQIKNMALLPLMVNLNYWSSSNKNNSYNPSNTLKSNNGNHEFIDYMEKNKLYDYWNDLWSAELGNNKWNDWWEDFDNMMKSLWRLLKN